MVFQKVGVKRVAKKRAAESQPLTHTLVLPRGFSYTFSVRPLLSGGAQGPDSNLVEIILPK
jgi:hypothetical protein